VRPAACAAGAALALALTAPSPLLAALDAPATPRVHALVNARIVTAPGRVIPRGTVVIRDGLIVAVGAAVRVPADARVWDAESLTVYPGMIDACVIAADAAPAAEERPGAAAAPGRRAPADEPRGATAALASVRPEARAVGGAPLGADRSRSLRAAGFTAAQVVPARGIVRGQSAVVGLGEHPPEAGVLRPDAAMVLSLEAWRDGYPGSLMGGIAVIRQALLDAAWYRDASVAYARAPRKTQRPATDVSLEAMQALVAGLQPALFLTDEMLEVLRAGAIAREAGVRGAILTAGDEYKRAADVAAMAVPLVVPVSFPEPPRVDDPELALEVTTEELRQWRDAPGNPAALEKARVRFALTANGLKDPRTFRANVARAIARGLSPETALAAVTTVPAALLGLGDRLGEIAPGRIANLTVTRGELFADSTQVREVWVDGDRHPVAEDAGEVAGTWSIDWGAGPHALLVAAVPDTSVRLVVGPDTLRAREVRLERDRLRFVVQRGGQPAERFALVAAFDRLRGTLEVPPGSHAVHGWKRPEPRRERAATPEGPPIPTPVVMGNSEAWRMPVPERPAAVLVRHATVWTAGPEGTLEDADLLVRSGRIAAVGRGLAAPAGALVIDATGKHVAPGILDEHSHAAVLGNVNECTHSVTCEVRIADVINSESVNIYRQLAGGVTVMHLLHGSCNAIGGQCAVIKNRWGEPPDRLRFAAAPPTVKFALGENPKQANFGVEATGRYPQTRGGVAEVYRDAFTRARDYQRQWADWRARRRPLPPRRDLRLDALAEIVDGVRLVHCHSYRQDEVLMMMRVAEEFGFRVNSFTHILEGYKVADEIAAHGASAIGFSDWWAYKQEVIDAIPWNAWLLWDRGVNTGFNSDSDELARHLNTEAAKAIKYGGMPPEEAIRTVTLNPAKALHVDSRVGSLEAGKDADFTLWSGPPLSPFSVCEQTWIEGRRYFDRAEDLAGRRALAEERAALIARARAARQDAPGGRGGFAGRPPRYLLDADLSGNACGGESHGGHDAFRSEAALGEEVGR
jgi:imidazolonepropionase-like amidohydrolase